MTPVAKIISLAIIAAAIVVSCQKLPTAAQAVPHLCPYGNPVYIISRDNDSAMYWIPNCFAPGDSTSPNDSLVEFGRNIAQTIVTITDSLNNIIVYDVHNFQYPGFNSHSVWNGNYLGGPAAEKCYLLQVRGTTLFGTSFNISGTVSLLRYFFGRDGTAPYYPVHVQSDSLAPNTPVLIKCDSCFFNTQWNGTGFNQQLPTNEHFVADTTHHCY